MGKKRLKTRTKRKNKSYLYGTHPFIFKIKYGAKLTGRRQNWTVYRKKNSNISKLITFVLHTKIISRSSKISGNG
jgi:hypothetical protein